MPCEAKKQGCSLEFKITGHNAMSTITVAYLGLSGYQTYTSVSSLFVIPKIDALRDHITVMVCHKDNEGIDTNSNYHCDAKDLRENEWVFFDMETDGPTGNRICPGPYCPTPSQ
jgi:hypothetical protein